MKRCVDLHGGSIEIESELGKGTCAKVTLPMFDATPAANSPPSQSDTSASKS